MSARSATRTASFPSREDSDDMKKLSTVLTALVCLVSPSWTAAQQPEPPDPQEVMAEFGTVIEDSGLQITVVHLNDQSVEALFTAPTKYSLRVQARQATMFYVQGMNQRPLVVRPDLAWQIRQDAEVIPARVVSINNFEANSQVSEGDQFAGLVVTDQLIDPRSAFTVENGEYHFDFAFSSSQADMIEGR
jgi:hypothetical protein